MTATTTERTACEVWCRICHTIGAGWDGAGHGMLCSACEAQRLAGIRWDADRRTLAITGAKAGDYCLYWVTPFDAEGGRGFQLAKIKGGTDPEADAYAVYLPTAGTAGHASCECRGWLHYRKPCRHMKAIQTLLETNQL